MPIKVRVGQSDAIKILSSAGGGSVSAQTAKNVIGGIASVTQLSVSGISTFNGNINAIGISTFVNLNSTNLNVAGISTFVGIVTTNNDLFVGGDLFTKGNLVLDNVTGSSLNITGLSTFVGNAQFNGNVSIAGTLTYEDVTNIDAVGLITARTGVRITTGGLIVNAGVSTFNAGVTVAGILTAGLIDGGVF